MSFWEAPPIAWALRCYADINTNDYHFAEWHGVNYCGDSQHMGFFWVSASEVFVKHVCLRGGWGWSQSNVLTIQKVSLWRCYDSTKSAAEKLELYAFACIGLSMCLNVIIYSWQRCREQDDLSPRKWIYWSWKIDVCCFEGCLHCVGFKATGRLAVGFWGNGAGVTIRIR